MVEQPYEGRSKVVRTFDGVEITIPTGKPIGIILFISFWLLMWLIGLSFALGIIGGGALFGAFGAGGLFMIFWVCGWTLGGVMALRMLIWLVSGEEVISAGNGVLTVRYKNLLFARSRSYELGSVKNLRVFDDGTGSFSFFNNRNASNMLQAGKMGIIRFDYGRKTVRFAEGIDEAEGKYLIDELKDAHVIVQEQIQ